DRLVNLMTLGFFPSLFFVTFYYNIKEKYFVLDCHNVLFINKGVSIDLLGNLVDISGGLGKEML
ncbi:TPA: hypothetical protein ACGO12_002369, partial [Streptococcus suis]